MLEDKELAENTQEQGTNMQISCFQAIDSISPHKRWHKNANPFHGIGNPLSPFRKNPFTISIKNRFFASETRIKTIKNIEL